MRAIQSSITGSNAPILTTDIETRKLNVEDVSQILAVQDIILDALPEDKKHFIAKRSKEDLLQYIQTKGLVIGLFSIDRLIAYSIVDLPKSIEEIDFDSSISIDDIDKVALFKSTVVIPEFRGKGLQKNLIDFRMNYANKLGRNVFITEVDPHNEASISSLISQGFFVKNVGISPVDGMPSLYLFHEQRDIKKHSLKMVHVSDLEQQKSLTNDSYIGISIEHSYITYTQL